MTGSQIGDDELARAVEADLVAHVAILHEPPAGEVHRENDVVWFRTGKTTPSDNGILRGVLPERDIDRKIEHLLEPFRALPMMWWFFPWRNVLSDRVRRALAAHGLTLDSDRPSMGLDLSLFQPPVVPAGATIERVRDEASLRAWARVVAEAFESPDVLDGPSVMWVAANGFGDDLPFRHYLCRVDGRPIGASTLSLGGGVAGLANISTVPEQRARGIGSAVAAAALVDARDLGIRIAALSADDGGVRVYEKLGFRTVGRHLTYVRRLGVGPDR